MIKVEKQGDPDGLCGIYCLINHMRDWGLEEEDKNGEIKKTNGQEALRYLLQAASTLGFLDSRRLVDGFEDFEIIQIFNRVAEWRRLDVRAVHLEEVGRKIGSDDLLETCKWVFDQGQGEVVLCENGGGHWVLAIASERSGFKVLDSDRASSDGNRKSISFMDGLHGIALLRPTSALANSS